jgi:hypothetical protein
MRTFLEMLVLFLHVYAGRVQRSTNSDPSTYRTAIEVAVKDG